MSADKPGAAVGAGGLQDAAHPVAQQRLILLHEAAQLRVVDFYHLKQINISNAEIGIGILINANCHVTVKL